MNILLQNLKIIKVIIEDELSIVDLRQREIKNRRQIKNRPQKTEKTKSMEVRKC